jgi:DNA-binding transcriptional regulator PaaX
VLELQIRRVSEYWLGEMFLDYNQLKLLILRIISDHVAIDANSVLAELVSAGARADIHAVRMALVRYHRLGLLKRDRVGGMYRYSLSERGIARLRWLERQSEKSKPDELPFHAKHQ